MIQPLWINDIRMDIRESVDKTRSAYVEKYRHLNLKIICILLDCMNDPIEFSNDQALADDIPESAKVCQELTFPYLFIFGGVKLNDNNEFDTLAMFDRCISQLDYCSGGVIEQFESMSNKTDLMVQACMLLSMDTPGNHLQYHDLEDIREELNHSLVEYLEEREETDATHDIWCIINFYGSSMSYNSQIMSYDFICSINIMSKIILEATRKLIRSMYYNEITTTEDVSNFYDKEIKKTFTPDD